MPRLLPLILLVTLLGTAVAPVARGEEIPSPVPGGASDSLARRLLDLGLENVSAEGSGDSLRVGYENRRYRHSAEAAGLVRRAAGAPVLAFERRLGMDMAAIAVEGGADTPRFRVRYPSDPDFPHPPAGPLRSPSFRRADLEFGPLLDYRIGRIFNPLELRVEMQPRIRLNPWPGSHVQLGVLIPMVNDYEPGDLDQDAGRFRPGRMSADQFGWIPGGALFSASGGYFGDNRWGAAVGIARPFAEGQVLFDAQIERTGYLAFLDSTTVFSNPRATSGFVGVSVRPGYSDVSIRLRGARYLYGDQGVEVEVRRSMGDFDLAYFAIRADGLSTAGIRLDLPVPPMRRAAPAPLRIQPVGRYSLSFRDRSEAFGTSVTGIGSREELLRQLSRDALQHNAIRFQAGRESRPVPRTRGDADWVSVSGMTGFINTPWAGVMADRNLEAGYNFVPRKWAYDHRGTNDNQVFYATIGFLPRVETSMRWTRIPGYRSFEEVAPDSRLVDIDRMSSARVQILTPTAARPGLAAGVEDVQGTRRFHSSYVVAGWPTSIFLVHCRLGLGYGFRAFDANRYVLDGAFGAIEAVPTRFARLQAEFDSEKWNLGLGWDPGLGFRVRTVLLNMESWCIGAGWSHAL